MNEFVVAATRSMRDYAALVTGHLTKFPSFASYAEIINGVNMLCTDRFADGEMEVSLARSVRGRDVVLFGSCARNEAGLSVEEAKIELYHAVDALKRSQARNIAVFEPFISCSRSDRTTRRNSVGLWMHFKTLANLGTSHIVTYQLHAKISQSMLDPVTCSIDDIPALTLLEKYLCDVYIRNFENLEKIVRPNWVFCSVDAGGEKFAYGFANAFGAPLVVAYKHRDYSRPNSIESINILSAEPLEGKVLWIVDDMVDTAGSVESLIRALAPHRPAEINVIVVHGVFSHPASERLSRLAEEGLLSRIVVTDTICPCTKTEKIPGLEVVPSAELSARIIRTLVANDSMSKLMRNFNAEIYLKSPNLFNQNSEKVSGISDMVK
ncbi:MAG: ribose-phosphate diphosphokinase [Treponema sp.]|jgi:ribose-phosphate pyrophosphokinase|nr:ribose-phosphate diphosphokinase [Treponema sp.]